MIFRFDAKSNGVHVTIRVFSASAAGQTFAKIGELTVRDGREWACLRALIVSGAALVGDLSVPRDTQLIDIAIDELDAGLPPEAD